MAKTRHMLVTNSLFDVGAIFPDDDMGEHFLFA